ncbi:MAG: response regulator transcription factor [Ignavibacteria bacterium]|nr:response regulator transcription factor [Ignavibacteria bacterium]
MKRRILFIEDDAGLALTLTHRLQAQGYSVQHAGTGALGLKYATDSNFDLILLDVMLPDTNGFDVCADIRLRGVRVPILMLTARGQTTDKVVGLNLGADDYMTKPFEVIELLARMEALFRRTQPSTTTTVIQQTDMNTLRFADIEIDTRGKEVRKSGIALDFSRKEYELLLFLIERKGDVLERDEILNHVWGYDAMPSTRTVDMHILKLRQKIEPNAREPQYILTVHGSGYKFVG